MDLSRSDEGALHSPLWRLSVERQMEVFEGILRPLVDRQLGHPGALHHGVERREVPLDEPDQVHRVVFHLGHRLGEALVGLEVRHQAEGHHRQRLLPQVAEEGPVGPDAVDVLVEFPDVRDAVEFGGGLLDQPLDRTRGRGNGG